MAMSKMEEIGRILIHCGASKTVRDVVSYPEVTLVLLVTRCALLDESRFFYLIANAYTDLLLCVQAGDSGYQT